MYGFENEKHKEMFKEKPFCAWLIIQHVQVISLSDLLEIFKKSNDYIYAANFIVTVLWQGSYDVVSFHLLGGTSRQQWNHVAVPPWFQHSDFLLLCT